MDCALFMKRTELVGENEMLRKLQIGKVLLKNNVILAPMAGVTDLPFRLLCARQ